MEIMLMDIEDMPKLAPLADSWIAETVDDIGPRVDKFACLSGVSRILTSGMGDVFVLVEGDQVYGILCIDYGSTGYSTEIMAKERYFYLLPHCRGRWSQKMRLAAEQRAALRGCSRIIFTVSAKASHDAGRICRYFGKSGYSPFEQSFIKELN